MLKGEYIIAIIGNAVNGLIVRIFTYLGVKTTIKFEKKKYENERYEKLVKEKAEFLLLPTKKLKNKKSQIQAFFAPFKVIYTMDNDFYFSYPKDILKKEQIIYHDYTFKNIGKSATTEFAVVVTNQKRNSLFGYDDYKDYIKNGYINYDCFYNYKIFPNESITIRLYYNKNYYFQNQFSSTFEIVYKDENGLFWAQPFFDNKNGLYEPYQITHEEFRNRIVVEQALECFEKPYLW